MLLNVDEQKKRVKKEKKKKIGKNKLNGYFL